MWSSSTCRLLLCQQPRRSRRVWLSLSRSRSSCSSSGRISPPTSLPHSSGSTRSPRPSCSARPLLTFLQVSGTWPTPGGLPLTGHTSLGTVYILKEAVWHMQHKALFQDLLSLKPNGWKTARPETRQLAVTINTLTNQHLTAQMCLTSSARTMQTDKNHATRLSDPQPPRRSSNLVERKRPTKSLAFGTS